VLLLTRNPKKDFYPACPVPTMYKGKVTREIPPWNGGDLIDSRSGHFVWFPQCSDCARLKSYGI